jgi:hypothetical protein
LVDALQRVKTANLVQMSALWENMPRLADDLDLLVVLKYKPTHLRRLIDDKRGRNHDLGPSGGS